MNDPVFGAPVSKKAGADPFTFSLKRGKEEGGFYSFGIPLPTALLGEVGQAIVPVPKIKSGIKAHSES
jgi:hypothetical protein